MAELTTTDRLQPSLLDRLTDDEPGVQAEGREKRVMSMRQLRRAVLRDLEWLLNASCRPRDDEVYQFPLVARSVLNYGLPDLSGLAAAGLTSLELEHMVFGAVTHFEPRIITGTLSVGLVETEGQAHEHGHVSFDIAGELCPLPMPEALYIRTDVDLDTGRFEVSETGARRA